MSNTPMPQDRPQPTGAPEVAPNPQTRIEGGDFPDYKPGPAQHDIGTGSGGEAGGQQPFRITGG